MRIGIAGVGRMGTAIAERLMGLGHEVAVWNRTADKTLSLAQAGAVTAATPARLTESSEIVITILTDADAIRAVYLGESGLLAAPVAGRLFLEMSTVRGGVKTQIDAEARARGASVVDCPVGGTVGPAREGRLICFVGGTDADVARAKPILDQLCRRAEHVGPVGAGATMKLAINLPLLVYWQALGEALLLCRPLNIDPARLMDIVADTPGAPNLLKARGGAIVAALTGEYTGPVTFDVDSIRKDLRTMIEEARSLGSSSPVAERALECFDQAASEGLGGSDGVALPARWAQRRGS